MYMDCVHWYKTNILPYWAKFRLFCYHWGALPYFVCFYTIKTILFICQKYIVWPVTGVDKILRKIYNGELYEKSAHVKTIITSCKPSSFDKVRTELMFITLHHSFQHPNYVLSDNVMLLDVEADKAIFIELPETLHHFTVKRMPFMFIHILAAGVKLIEMPIPHFHRLAKEVGDPHKYYERVTLLFNIGRSGSTIIARMIEECDPDTIVLSEPPVFFAFIKMRTTGHAPPGFFRPALKSSMLLLMKPIKGKKRLMIKPTHFSHFLADYIHEDLPYVNMYYCYRDPMQIIKSQERAFSISPAYKLLHFFLYFRIWPQFERIFGLWRSPFLEHYINSCLSTTVFECCVMIWADCYLRYLSHKEKFYYPTIHYDGFLANPKQFCGDILKLFNLPETMADKALSVVRSDVQDGTCLGQNVLRDVPVTTEYDSDLKERVNKFCDGLNLPRLNWELTTHRSAPLLKL